MTSSREHWKNFERTVAKLFGGRRIPINGRGDEPDIKTSTHTVECKHWDRLPYRVEQALMQAERNNEPGALPLAIIGQRGRRWQDALVVMRLDDYIEWYSPKGNDDVRDSQEERSEGDG